MIEKTRIAVLVSGGGTNLQAIIDAVNSGKITNSKLSVVISNKDDAYVYRQGLFNGNC